MADHRDPELHEVGDHHAPEPRERRVAGGHEEEEKRRPTGRSPRVSWRIFTIARFTHPMMIRLIGSAR
jgi:hypothetical protein